MKSSHTIVNILISAAAAIAVMLLSWQVYQRYQPVSLDGVEIREYQGEMLSSVANDFRENSIKGPQFIERESYRLEVSGLVNNRLNLSYSQLTEGFQDYQKVVTLYCVEGWDAKILWQGLKVEDLFIQAGLNPKANTVIFHATDGYTTSFPIEYLIENEILLAYKMNGVTIPPERGFPLILVAESKWGYKWIKWITKIELSDDVNYQGYWESRGYSDSGDLDEDFFK
ncbi:Oxidoreductase molybdopterin binding domain [Dehalogenimonas alkenigignens]|jgi:DMSO/TMAO reductase YedYZ molybdopterin-dependent catalytic subunit|uniref:Oxidoreductase molybdopterin binding domain n=1 Tax=Dehalogenimonas alkenigignens TaxID=1217799 RepID=A0A0W0GIY5_9CHLR|nr:Oxidoreductase molybdopterin binding domain [Dehalogenimonas alkenigignens]